MRTQIRKNNFYDCFLKASGTSIRTEETVCIDLPLKKRNFQTSMEADNSRGPDCREAIEKERWPKRIGRRIIRRCRAAGDRWDVTRRAPPYMASQQQQHQQYNKLFDDRSSPTCWLLVSSGGRPFGRSFRRRAVRRNALACVIRRALLWRVSAAVRALPFRRGHPSDASRYQTTFMARLS